VTNYLASLKNVVQYYYSVAMHATVSMNLCISQHVKLIKWWQRTQKN